MEMVAHWPAGLWQSGEITQGREMADDPANDLDRRDVNAARDGDERAFERLVRRHQQAVGNWMWRFTRDRTALDELTQEVLVEAYYSLKSFKGRSSFRTWLLAIATRVGYGYWRRSARDKEREEAACRELTLDRDWETAGPGEAAETLYGVLEGLLAKERLVLTLMYFEELGVREIAGMTGWSESLVKVRAYRARRRLKVLLESEGMGRSQND